VYDRDVLPERERIVQLARLAGVDAFAGRFGEPRSAQPEHEMLRAFLDERLESIVGRLVEEAAASDDVLDGGSASVYLEDRLSVLGDLLMPDQAERIRQRFREKTEQW
jgi:hypothetical protein